MPRMEKGAILAALDAIDEAVAFYDGDDRLVVFNTRYAELRAAIGGDVHLDVRWEDLVRASVRAGRIPEAIGREEEWLAYRRKKRGAYSIKRQVPDGRWFQVNERQMPDGGIAVVWTDISNLVQTQQKLESALQALDKANAARIEALHNTAHELRAPLTTILLYTEMLAARKSEPQAQERYTKAVNSIHFAALHLAGVVNGLLDIAKGESRTLEIHETLCDLDDIIDAGICLITSQSEKKGTLMRHVRGPACGRCSNLARIDEQRMRQVVLNLLSNAVKFTPSGGSIETGVRAMSNGSRIIYVRDTGLGIAPEDLDKVMLPFGRAGVSRSAGVEGTGLGLAVSKAIIEAHGGTLRLESTPGGGITALVCIPPERIVDCTSPFPCTRPDTV